MAAKEISRTFDLSSGSITVMVDNGYRDVHPVTIYVATVPDANQAILDAIKMVGDSSDAIHAKMVAAGMQSVIVDTPSTNG